MAEHDDCEMTRLARLAAMTAEEPKRVARAVPGSFGCHEALDRTAKVMDIIGDWLLEHPSIVRDPAWFRLADEAHTKLFGLYQAIGLAHLVDEDFAAMVDEITEENRHAEFPAEETRR